LRAGARPVYDRVMDPERVVRDFCDMAWFTRKAG
jgi:hypothetical protein